MTADQIKQAMHRAGWARDRAQLRDAIVACGLATAADRDGRSPIYSDSQVAGILRRLGVPQGVVQ